MLLLGLTAFLLASPLAPPPTPVASTDESAPVASSDESALVASSDEDVETPFVPSSPTFADAAACRAHLVAWVRASAPPAYDAAVGPYVIAPGDTRAHRVAARDWAHEIEEQRCLGAGLSSRRWTHSMTDVKPITLDDIRKMSFPAKLMPGA